jgi:hypothetical protein
LVFFSNFIDLLPPPTLSRTLTDGIFPLPTNHPPHLTEYSPFLPNHAAVWRI